MTTLFSGRCTRRSVLILLSGLLIAPGAFAKKPERADLTRFVVVGDSLSAGVQNISLDESQQIHGFIPLIARQAGIDLVQPLIESPGDPARLDVQQEFPLILGPVGGVVLPPSQRINPADQPNNLAVPGFAVGDPMTAHPKDGAAYTTADNVQRWTNLVLGYPARPEPRTQVQIAKELNPTTLLVWVGSNNALVPSFLGAFIPQAGFLAPEEFEEKFAELLSELSTTNATMIVANIPDVTLIPYFISADYFARAYSRPVNDVRTLLGLGNGDVLRMNAAPLVRRILTGEMQGPLPALCPSTIGALPAPAMPCVMRAAEVELVRDRVKAYNKAIKRQADKYDAVLVDIFKLVNDVDRKGVVVRGERLTTEPFGGLFSLDGMHPSNTGYAVIANEFLDVMKKELKVKSKDVDLKEVWSQDPIAARRGLSW